MNLDVIVRRQKKWMVSLITISLVAAFATKYSAFFFGYSIGALFSMYSIWLLARKVKLVAQRAAMGKGSRSLGTVSRLAATILAVFCTIKFPETFNVYGVVLGLVTCYIVIMIDYFIFKLTQSGEER